MHDISLQLVFIMVKVCTHKHACIHIYIRTQAMCTLLVIKAATLGSNANYKVLSIRQIYYIRSNIRLNFQEILNQKLMNQHPESVPRLEAIIIVICLVTESYREWMACTAAHAVSTFFISAKSGECAKERQHLDTFCTKEGPNNIIYIRSCIYMLKCSVLQDLNKR